MGGRPVCSSALACSSARATVARHDVARAPRHASAARRGAAASVANSTPRRHTSSSGSGGGHLLDGTGPVRTLVAVAVLFLSAHVGHAGALVVHRAEHAPALARSIIGPSLELVHGSAVLEGDGYQAMLYGPTDPRTPEPWGTGAVLSTGYAQDVAGPNMGVELSGLMAPPAPGGGGGAAHDRATLRFRVRAAEPWASRSVPGGAAVSAEVRCSYVFASEEFAEAAAEARVEAAQPSPSLTAAFSSTAASAAAPGASVALGSQGDGCSLSFAGVQVFHMAVGDVSLAQVVDNQAGQHDIGLDGYVGPGEARVELALHHGQEAEVVWSVWDGGGDAVLDSACLVAAGSVQLVITEPAPPPAPPPPPSPPPARSEEEEASDGGKMEALPAVTAISDPHSPPPSRPSPPPAPPSPPSSPPPPEEGGGGALGAVARFVDRAWTAIAGDGGDGAGSAPSGSAALGGGLSESEKQTLAVAGICLAVVVACCCVLACFGGGGRKAARHDLEQGGGPGTAGRARRAGGASAAAGRANGGPVYDKGHAARGSSKATKDGYMEADFDEEDEDVENLRARANRGGGGSSGRRGPVPADERRNPRPTVQAPVRGQPHASVARNAAARAGGGGRRRAAGRGAAGTSYARVGESESEEEEDLLAGAEEREMAAALAASAAEEAERRRAATMALDKGAAAQGRRRRDAPPHPHAAAVNFREAEHEVRASRARLGADLQVNVAEGVIFQVKLRLAEDGRTLFMDDRAMPCKQLTEAEPGWPSSAGTGDFHPTLCFELLINANPIRFLARSPAEALGWLAALHEEPATGIPQRRRRSLARLGFARLRLMWQRALVLRDLDGDGEEDEDWAAGDDDVSPERGGRLEAVRADLLAQRLGRVVHAAEAADARARDGGGGGGSARP